MHDIQAIQQSRERIIELLNEYDKKVLKNEKKKKKDISISSKFQPST